MSQQPKRSKMPSGFLLILFGLGLAYGHGYRVMDMSDVPSSHRPLAGYLSTEYGASHFSQN